MDCSQCQEQMSIYKYLSFNLTVMDFRIIMAIITILILIAGFLTYKYFIKHLKLKELIENRKKPYWCSSCDVNMIFAETFSKGKYAVIADSDIRAIYHCPKCGKSTFEHKLVDGKWINDNPEQLQAEYLKS